MARAAQIIPTAIRQTFGELRANKLRTFLSLLGITIGIFCIISVLTLLDSLEENIRSKVGVLGSDVLYISRKPWTADDGEYKWWEYLQRKPLGPAELAAITHAFQNLQAASLLYSRGGQTIKADGHDAAGSGVYAVTEGFDRMQNIELQQGRYLTLNELTGAGATAVIGQDLAEALYGPVSPLGRTLAWRGKILKVVGVTKKAGQNMTGFNFDEGMICPFGVAASLFDLGSLDWSNDPTIMIKAPRDMPTDELKDELTGILRTERRIKPGGKPDFSINQLSQITKKLTSAFAVIDVIGLIIGGFSLIVGTFGIANIMFVTVRERTKVIGLKRAIGASRRVIITEFLIEAIMLCIIGGLIGIIIVLLLAFLLSHALDFPVTLSLKNFSLGISISAFVGLLAGYVPARRASRLDPVVAIRTTG